MARSKPIGLVVRRGALRRFDALKRKSAELPVNVLWDNRTNDRRKAAVPVPTDRRRSDRRQPPPFTWDTADFVVVPGSRGRKKS
jgi:hypothetical protein